MQPSTIPSCVFATRKTMSLRRRQPLPFRKDALILSYLDLRKIVGVMALTLPLVLALGKILVGSPGLESSISNYYYSEVRNIFVGSMCVIGLFLAACRGYDRRDAIAGTFAGICAIGLALFPCGPDPAEQTRGYIFHAWHVPIGWIHLSFALGLFLTVAYFCLYLFTLTSATEMTPHKVIRNRVYMVCGWVILACIALCTVTKIMESSPLLKGFHPIFWFESLAVMAFGVAWLVKGELFLKDSHTRHAPVTYMANPTDAGRVPRSTSV
jgi:hypothetical protein